MKKISYICLILIFSQFAMASNPQMKTYRTQSDFEKGESQGISITSRGELLLAPDIEEICDAKEAFIWDIVADRKGTIYYSAGNEGKIFSIDSKGKARVFFQLDEIQVHALSLDGQDRLYAGSSPDGKVYRIAGDSTATVIYDPEDTYIWDLLFDGNDQLFIAAGDSATIYRVDAAGKGSLFYRSEESHIRCLAWDRSGNLLAGSLGNGYIYRISPKAEGFVIYDSDLQEIHQICVNADGSIYAAAWGERAMAPKPSAVRPMPETDMTQETSEMADEELNGAIVIGEIKIEAPRPVSPEGGVTESAIYKIMPNGIILNLWNDYKEPVQSMILTDGGKLLVGTGKTGKMMQFTPDDEKTILFGSDAAQITGFFKKPSGDLLFVTANMGKIYRFSPDFRSKGSYLSEVFDSFTISRWGSIRWDAKDVQGGSVHFSTRSGNTEEPNSTWSEWSPRYTRSEGANISSENSRFIQWKLDLASGDRKRSPKIERVDISYLQKNLPPVIYDIMLYPPGEISRNAQAGGGMMEEDIDLDRTASNKQAAQKNQYSGRRPYRKGIQSVSWSVADDNNDKMNYHLFYREQEERNWKKLIKNWSTNSYSWDTERFPDGTYFLKVIATDSLSNPHEFALTSEKISQSFEIDNTGPEVLNLATQVKGSQVVVTFKVTDRYNAITEVSYSVDGGDWKIGYPVDGINDTKAEEFSIPLNYERNGGMHSIVIKATDQVENIGFGRTFFEDK